MILAPEAYAHDFVLGLRPVPPLPGTPHRQLYDSAAGASGARPQGDGRDVDAGPLAGGSEPLGGWLAA